MTAAAAAAVPGLAVLGLAAALAAAGAREASVGLPAVIEGLVLEGSEVEVARAEAASPIVLRIVGAWPHGSAFRYDLEYTGLEPGEFDLARFLRRADGSDAQGLPPIPVTIRSGLPEGDARPHPPRPGGTLSFGGYRALLAAGAFVWAAGLAAIVVLGRKRRRAEEREAGRPRMTLADRLEPLVERAIAGALTRTERAEVELLLVEFWRKRLGLGDVRAEETWARLREHAEAGPLVRGLEAWLHRPEPPGSVDVARLLEPYRDVRAAAPRDAEPGASG